MVCGTLPCGRHHACFCLLPHWSSHLPSFFQLQSPRSITHQLQVLSLESFSGSSLALHSHCYHCSHFRQPFCLLSLSSLRPLVRASLSSRLCSAQRHVGTLTILCAKSDLILLCCPLKRPLTSLPGVAWMSPTSLLHSCFFS